MHIFKCCLVILCNHLKSVPLLLCSKSSLDMPDSVSSEPGSKVSDPQHSQKLLRVLRTFWQEQSFHDALLVVDGEELPVQKNILSAASPYIRSENLASDHLARSFSTYMIMQVLSLACVYNV